MIVPQKTVLTPGVIISAQQVHGLAQFVQVDDGADADEQTQGIPAPVGTCTETVGNAPAEQLVTDSGGDPVEPYDACDAEGDRYDDECQQAVVHGLLAIITGADGVDIVTHLGEEHQGVDAEGDDA